MRRLPSRKVLVWLVILSLPLIACSNGCAVLYQLAYGDGRKIPAKYQGLKGQRVAVVCVMNASTYGDATTSMYLANRVERILQSKVDEVKLVRQDEVADWLDTNDWDENDFTEIGRGVNADMVVGIQIDGFSIFESKTLLKGRAELAVTVYDIKQEKEVFRTTDHNFTFPQSHAVPIISGDPRAFQRTFIELLAGHIAKNFYDYDMVEDFATDGAAYAH